jgi:hypothetical protein
MLNLGFITEALQNLVAYFFDDFRYKLQSYWFKITLYGFVLIKCLYWLIYFDVYFGGHSIVYTNPLSIGPVNDFAYLLYNHQSPTLSLVSLILMILLCLAGLIFKKRFLLSDGLLWFLTLNIHNQVYPGLSSGDYLLNQFLVFNCFISYQRTILPTFSGHVKILLHNLGSIALIVQLCLAYFLSGLAKLFDIYWQNGQAIGMTSQINHFSLYSLPQLSLNYRWIMVFLTYLVLVYQLSFPVVTFIKPLKKIYLLIGVVMHVYIGLVMGLPFFATTMIIGYIYFWPFHNSVVSIKN